jgi:hypothetical protein
MTLGYKSASPAPLPSQTTIVKSKSNITNN